jgi:MoxR-like ATPase
VRGLTVVVTGTMRGTPRDVAIAALQAAGARVTSQISGTTDLLICGQRVGDNKKNAATRLGVTMVAWSDVDLTPVAQGQAQPAPAAAQNVPAPAPPQAPQPAAPVAAPAAPAPAPAPGPGLMARLQASVAVQPNWSNDGTTFKVWLPENSQSVIELPVAKKAGSHTPSEDVWEVLGQPHLLFAICFAISTRKHVLLNGPTGTAKTTMFRWLVKQLKWNLILMPISRGTEAAHMVGEYLPVDEAGKFLWTYGPVALATLLSQKHPTVLLFDEVNRIGNVQEFARVYSLLDDSRMLEMKEKRSAKGDAEVLRSGDLYVGATSNPADDDSADYVGVNTLDAAFASRFGVAPKVDYPVEEVEATALARRVKGLDAEHAMQMVQAATRIRKAAQVRFPISFRELEAWALALPLFGWEQGAEVAVVNKAHPDDQASIRDLVKMRPQQAGGFGGGQA